MNKNLHLLYDYNRSILAETERIIYIFRAQDYDRALRETVKMMGHMNSFLNLLPSCMDCLSEYNIILDHDSLTGVLQELTAAQERKDYILLADIYEAVLIPLLRHFQEEMTVSHIVLLDCDYYIDNSKMLIIRNPELGIFLKEAFDYNSVSERGYIIEPSSVGDMTIACGIDNRHYLHSNNNVWKEAMVIAQSWYKNSKSFYIIYGLGLLYHVYELFRLDEFIEIEVYESNIDIIRLACAYSKHLEIFRNPQVRLVYDPDFTGLARRIDSMEDNMEFVIHYPSLQILQDGPVKQKLEYYFIQYSSQKSQLPLLNGNFARNIKNCGRYVEELREVYQGRDLYIIAAGPSLDKNFFQLKEVKGRGIILATGTVFKKLINAGITPDYVLVTDPNARVYKQIAGLEDCEVPMLFLSTAYYGFAENYKRGKYLICQRDFPKAEEYAREKGLMTFRTGGSVSTTALDIGIMLGCRRIIFIGLDLAYTDRYAHASSTSRRNATDFDNLLQVEDIYGNMVYTSRSLNMFRLWIENRISNEKGMEFIDATEGGAKIKGMRIARLEDVICKSS